MVNIYKFCKKEKCKKVKNEVTGRKNVIFGLFIWKNLKINFFGSCDFNYNFFAIFSKMRQTLATLPVILSLWTFCSSNFYNSFFSIVEKLNISAIYKSIILIFSVNLPVIFIYKFCRKENLIQPPGEPLELNLLNFNN